MSESESLDLDGRKQVIIQNGNSDWYLYIQYSWISQMNVNLDIKLYSIG
jgi:hypothetical protein